MYFLNFFKLNEDVIESVSKRKGRKVPKLLITSYILCLVCCIYTLFSLSPHRVPVIEVLKYPTLQIR